MTNTEIDILANTIRGLWPRIARGAFAWSPAEWSVLDENAARIEITPDQAVIAVRALKARSDKYPVVSAVLAALKTAENRPHVGAASPMPRGYVRPEPLKELDEYGFTSFERRVIDDPRFRPFARKHGRLSDERETAIFSRAIRAGIEVPE